MPLGLQTKNQFRRKPSSLYGTCLWPASTADEYKNGENPDLSYKGKLEGLGFTSLVSDPCLFERTDSRGKIMVALYVDDISFAATTDDLADEFLEDT